MQSARIQLLKRMEALKLANKLNFGFTMVVLLLISLQIAFVVRVEIEQAAYVPATMIYTLASKYVDNLALTFLPILLLVHVGSGIDILGACKVNAEVGYIIAHGAGPV